MVQKYTYVHVHVHVSPSHLVVWSVDDDEREEAIAEGLVEHLEEAGSVAGLHGFIVLVLLKLLLNSDKIEHRFTKLIHNHRHVP